jgi:hypothetical protein
MTNELQMLRNRVFRKPSASVGSNKEAVDAVRPLVKSTGCGSPTSKAVLQETYNSAADSI